VPSLLLEQPTSILCTLFKKRKANQVLENSKALFYSSFAKNHLLKYEQSLDPSNLQSCRERPVTTDQRSGDMSPDLRYIFKLSMYDACGIDNFSQLQ
jgi:hypothetical protein